MHLFIISIALRSEDVPTSGASPRQRTRLVANHASSPRAAQADKTVASTDTIDSRQSSHRREPSRPAPHAPPRERVPVAPAPAPEDGTGPRDSEMPRHFDPCADNDCGLIASAPYATAGRGREAGDDYQLRPHRELSLSVVTCDEVLGCKTVTGDDQDDIRAEVGRHVAALDACFDTATAGATSAVEVRAVDGTIRARAHDGDALGSCLAAALGGSSSTPTTATSRSRSRAAEQTRQVTAPGSDTACARRSRALQRRRRDHHRCARSRARRSS